MKSAAGPAMGRPRVGARGQRARGKARGARLEM